MQGGCWCGAQGADGDLAVRAWGQRGDRQVTVQSRAGMAPAWRALSGVGEGPARGTEELPPHQPSQGSLPLKAKCQPLALTQPFPNSIRLWKGLRATSRSFHSPKVVRPFKPPCGLLLRVPGWSLACPRPPGSRRRRHPYVRVRQVWVQLLCCRGVPQVAGEMAGSQ